MPAAPSASIEVERTFTAEQATELPDLVDGLVDGMVVDVREVGVVATLVATYHDTADLRLLRAGITLRRREGGHDEGWHVKVGRGQSRLELHRPLTKSTRPPVAIRSLLRGAVRAAAVVPVAEVLTRRSRLQLAER